MSVNCHGFVEWEEKFVSQERGNRVVHYFLKDSAGNSVLAVVGTEKTLRRIVYVVSEEFLQVYGSEKSVNACFKWRSRREVVDWLTLLLLKQPSPRDRSSEALPTYVRSLVEKDHFDEPEASETEKVKSLKPPTASKGTVIKAKNIGLKKRYTRQSSFKTVGAGTTIVVDDDPTLNQPSSVKKPRNTPMTSVRKGLLYSEYPKDVMNDDVVSRPDSPLDDAEFWASLEVSLSVPQSVSTESRIDPSLVIEAKKKLTQFIAMDLLNVLHPDRRTALAETISVLQSLPDLSQLHRSFLHQVSSILLIGYNFDEDAKKLADVDTFLSEYDDLKVRALSLKDSHERLKSEATPLGEEIGNLNHQIKLLRGRLADLESSAKQKEQEMKLILKEAKLTVQKRQSMAPEAGKAEEQKSLLQSRQEEILKLWADTQASFPSDL
ncbi:hypothetical protein HHK36_030363 [Tetracentron sinense]|uniref:Uncharacterized protein n=1 Tax=Tetracentron sinense TaxID=13715 RepID=A0A835D0J7_TETSI|nr:hypothetical protein HHK36_030363 [Tetracentron sinense]